MESKSVSASLSVPFVRAARIFLTKTTSGESPFCPASADFVCAVPVSVELPVSAGAGVFGAISAFSVTVCLLGAWCVAAGNDDEQSGNKNRQCECIVFHVIVPKILFFTIV